MRLLYDSTNPNDIPQTAQLVGYYVDGIYAKSVVGVRARFPNAILVGISALGTNAGVVGDVEPGCMTFNQGIDWVKRRRAAGVDPTIYCNQNNAWAGLRATFARQGVAEPHWWVANYDGVRVIPAGAVAKQYANPALTGHHYDLSVCADVWPGVDDGLHGGGGTTVIGEDMTPEQAQQLAEARNYAKDVYDTLNPAVPNDGAGLGAENLTWAQWLIDLKSKLLAAIGKAPAGTAPDLTQLITDVAGIKADVAEIRARVAKDLAP